MMKQNFQRTAFNYADEAKIERRKGRVGFAEDLLREGLRCYPDDVTLLVGMGNLYRDTRRDDQAMAVYERAFALHPKAQAAIMSYANFLTTRRAFEKAEDIYAHMFALNGERDMRLLTALGNLYQNAGRNSLAAACFGRAATLPNADDYAGHRYKEICSHYSPGYREAEWVKFTVRMEERKNAAAQSLSTASAPAAAAAVPKPAPDTDQPVYNGPVWN